MISARFLVCSITSYAGYSQVDVLLKPGASTANVAWSKYTPNGEIRMSVTLPETIAWFTARLGQEVDILMGDAGSLPGHPEFKAP